MVEIEVQYEDSKEDSYVISRYLPNIVDDF